MLVAAAHSSCGYFGAGVPEMEALSNVTSTLLMSLVADDPMQAGARSSSAKQLDSAEDFEALPVTPGFTWELTGLRKRHAIENLRYSLSTARGKVPF